MYGRSLDGKGRIHGSRRDPEKRETLLPKKPTTPTKSKKPAGSLIVSSFSGTSRRFILRSKESIPLFLFPFHFLGYDESVLCLVS